MCLVTGTQTPMAGPLVSQGFREMNGCDKDTVATDPKEGRGRGSPQLEACSEMTLARGSSTKDATVLTLSFWACPSRPWGVSGSMKPLMVLSGKILKEYSPVV